MIRVQTLSGIIAPEIHSNGRVTVDMGAPQLDPAKVPFTTEGLQSEYWVRDTKWPLALDVNGQKQLLFG